MIGGVAGRFVPGLRLAGVLSPARTIHLNPVRVSA